MTETPSGNRWEPSEDDATQPLMPTRASGPPTAADPDAEPVAEPVAGPVAGPVAPPEYGWAPSPQSVEAAPPRRDRRRTGALAASAAALVIGAAVGGYAFGAATAGSDHEDVGTTRQAPPHGFAPKPGFPDRDGAGDDHDQFGGTDGGTDGDSDSGTDQDGS